MIDVHMTHPQVFVDEHEAWKTMFDEIQKLTKVDLNKQHRRIFALIEKWAYYDRIRRDALRDGGSEFADDFGIFWHGED